MIFTYKLMFFFIKLKKILLLFFFCFSFGRLSSFILYVCFFFNKLKNRKCDNNLDFFFFQDYVSLAYVEDKRKEKHNEKDDSIKGIIYEAIYYRQINYYNNHQQLRNMC